MPDKNRNQRNCQRPACSQATVHETLQAEERRKKAVPPFRKWIRPLLFTAVGALAGYAYYRFVGCSTGSCPITASPVSSTAYMALVGLLLSGAFGKECNRCNM